MTEWTIAENYPSLKGYIEYLQSTNVFLYRENVYAIESLNCLEA